MKSCVNLKCNSSLHWYLDSGFLVFLPFLLLHQIYFSRVAITYLGWRQQVWHWRAYNLESRGRPPIHHTKARKTLYSRGSPEAWETCGCALYIYTGQQLLYTRPQQHRPDRYFCFQETCIYCQYNWLNKLPDPIILFLHDSISIPLRRLLQCSVRFQLKPV